MGLTVWQLLLFILFACSVSSFVAASVWDSTSDTSPHREEFLSEKFASPSTVNSVKFSCLLIRPCFLLPLLHHDDWLVLCVLWQASYSRSIRVMADYWFLMPPVRYFSISLPHLTVFFTFLLSLFIMPSILLWNGTGVFQKMLFNIFLYLYCDIWSHCLLFSLHRVFFAL